MNLKEIIESLPNHLKPYVAEQNYSDYTAQDHALWRYVMRQNIHRLSKVAHETYVKGLEQTGISLDKIPDINNMNEILQHIGWAAIAVDGFIPPSSFMEFQARKILVIAADIRPIDQIGYTPAPDIIHEAAGHAPIIADEDYAEYLRLFGEIGSKAFSSALDFEIYEAVRKLSIIKTNPYTPENEILEAEKQIEKIAAQVEADSEMAKIRNMHWWTVEYGLVGTLEEPKIYGAGLLSSIQESFNCLTDKVKKLPYSIEAADFGFDITKEQPQLFVTPDFPTLTKILNQFADTMAVRRGGLYALKLAEESKNDATAVYSSGLSVSGVFDKAIEKDGEAIYLRTKSATALSFDEKQIENHGKTAHADGFGSPIGKFKATATAPELLTEAELNELGIKTGQLTKIEFDSGVLVEGIVSNILRKQDKLCIISFTDCTVTYNGSTLFDPNWGVYDMAIGESITSGYQGVADPDAYGLELEEIKDKTIKIEHSEEAKKLHELYEQASKIRENNASPQNIVSIWESIKADYPDEWLLPVELLEMAREHKIKKVQIELSERLYIISKTHKYADLVHNGMILSQF